MHALTRAVSTVAATALVGSGLTVGLAAPATAAGPVAPATAQTGPVEDLLSALTAPVLQGVPQVASTLQVTKPVLSSLLGVITGQSVQWYRGGVPIPGATAWTYQLTAADAGQQVTAKVTSVVQTLLETLHLDQLTDPLLVAPAATDPTATLRLLVEPVITGLTKVGSTLSVADPGDGDWSLAGVEDSIQWFRDGSPIDGATAWTYLLDPADVGTSIHAVITGTVLGLLPVETVLPPQQVEELKALFTPLMSGLAKVGETLSVGKPGDAGWNHPGVEATIQWFRDNVPVPGATGWTFPVTPEDAGKQLTAVITGTLGSVGIPVAVPGKTVEKQAIEATTPPGISPGQPKVGDVLTVTEPVWNVEDVGSPTYEWFRGATPVGTGTSYTVTRADVDQPITVVATVTKGEETGTSTSAPVTPASDVLTPTRQPSIAPASDVDHGDLLTVDPGAWGTDPAPTFGYQWLRNGEVIEGARQRTYEVQVADVTSKLSVVVTANRDGFEPGTATTAPVTVDKLVARTDAKLKRKRIRKGQAAVLRISTTAVGVNVPGKVKIFDGKKRVRTVKVAGAAKKVRIKVTRVGKHKLRVVHVGNQYVERSSDSVRLVVKRAGR